MKKLFAANITVIGDSSYLLGFYSDYLQPMETTLFVFWSTRSVPLYIAQLYDTTFLSALCTPSLDCLNILYHLGSLFIICVVSI